MNSSSMTSKASNTPGSSRASTVTDLQHDLKKGDEYRDRGDFDKAKAKYEKAAKFCPSEAEDRLVILPLCQASMESSAPERTIPVGWRARAHNTKERVKQVYRHPSPVPSLPQSFFPRPSLSTQSTVATLAISDSQSAFMSVSTCTTTSTSTNQATTATSVTLASGTIVGEVGSVTDVRSLMAVYQTADEGAREVIKTKFYDIIEGFAQGPKTFDTVQELVVLAAFQDRDVFLHIITKILCVLKETPLLSGIALQGLAVILDTIPGGTDLTSLQGIFVEILTSLQHLLHAVRTVNNDLQLIPLLSAFNALLDAMVRRQVSGLDREAVYSDLRTRLTALTSNSNVM
ncbi:hypothetical protein BGZ70_003217, partial [Mortierella alpina]